MQTNNLNKVQWDNIWHSVFYLILSYRIFLYLSKNWLLQCINWFHVPLMATTHSLNYFRSTALFIRDNTDALETPKELFKVTKKWFRVGARAHLSWSRGVQCSLRTICASLWIPWNRNKCKDMYTYNSAVFSSASPENVRECWAFPQRMHVVPG